MRSHQKANIMQEYERPRFAESLFHRTKCLHLSPDATFSKTMDLFDEFDDLVDEAMQLAAAAVAMDDVMEAEEEEEEDAQWGGSSVGKAPNKQRDFAGAYDRLMRQYFSGDESVYNESDFEKRFRMPRHVFHRLWTRISGKGCFVQHFDVATKLPGVHPLVRFVACLRKLSYGESSDRADENLEISESVVNSSFKQFCSLIVQEFGPIYLHRCPSQHEIERALRINASRGFPGNFASWDCKHFSWKNCPMAFAGQHKGKEDSNTLVLEAICDPDCYIWYSFFGSPGSLNDLNILDRSSIVARMLDGSFNLRLPEHLHYTVNGTRRDYMYFLVDGIYPRWSVFVSTIANASPHSKEAKFAKKQEANRKDIERAFGQLVQKFKLLKQPQMMWRKEDVSNAINCGIILHNMTVEVRRENFVSQGRLDELPAPVEEPAEIPTVSLFHQVSQTGDLVNQGEAAVALASRVAQFDADLKNEVAHHALVYDLKEHIYSKY